MSENIPKPHRLIRTNFSWLKPPSEEIKVESPTIDQIDLALSSPRNHSSDTPTSTCDREVIGKPVKAVDLFTNGKEPPKCGVADGYNNDNERY